MGSTKEHKQSLKLILKVGNIPTTSIDDMFATEELENSALYSRQTSASTEMFGGSTLFTDNHHSHHKKSKKKKKKKEKHKDKDRDKDKDRVKKHKHKHKSKKKHRREEPTSQDDGSVIDDDGANDGTTYASLGSKDKMDEDLNGSDMSGEDDISREPRSCVLKRKNEQTPLQKLLEHLLKTLEKRDPKQFFAYPVTDNIAPGYSKIISHPMDFSTIRQKINDNKYATLQEFISDFKLMCTNAMHYNHSDTIYYKASKKLLHGGLKLMQPEKLGWLLSYVSNLTSDELGFEVCSVIQTKSAQDASVAESQTESTPDHKSAKDDVLESETVSEKTVQRSRKTPDSKFEAYVDDMEPDEILSQVHDAAQKRKNMLMAANGGTPMGFLRQRKDGTTSLAILIGGDGIIPGTNQRPVLLGSLVGKLTEGTSQLTGFREDRRNQVKTVKPLYYGAFGSYAPSYDSAFANLSKEDSELILQTYGSENAVQYAESIIDFSKDSDYAIQMADNLLDSLTNGEHSKSKEIIEERRKLREEEETVRRMLQDPPMENNVNGYSVQQTNGIGDDIDISALKSLSDIGIDTSFLKLIEDSQSGENFVKKLDETSKILNKLHQVQHERLSTPLPSLEDVPGPTENEMSLAQSVTNQLTDLAKQLTPGDIAPVAGLRKAMGMTLPPPPTPPQRADNDPMEVDLVDQPEDPLMTELESELIQFLENSHSAMIRDDNTIDEIFMT